MKSTIDGVTLFALDIISTAGGPVLHMIRSDNPLAQTGIGEVYFSEVLPDHIKAWKCHTKQTQRFAVPYGKLKIVLYDDRVHSQSRGVVEIYELGRPDNYYLLCFPPMIWYGFTALGKEKALICNCPDLPHDPTEGLRKDPNSPDIPYNW